MKVHPIALAAIWLVGHLVGAVTYMVVHEHEKPKPVVVPEEVVFPLEFTTREGEVVDLTCEAVWSDGSVRTDCERSEP